MDAVRIRGLRVVRGDDVVLDGLDLDVAAGSRLAVLGASGSGKTTLLRCIAGLERPVTGRIWFGDRDVTDLPPHERQVAMVSQGATLQPHLDVHGNLAFPLRIRHVRRAETAQRVDAEARAFSLQALLPRRPRTLSLGEQHEVALARSLVRRGSILLVDEPLANVDAVRRTQLQRELIEVQQGYGVTLVVATNDQRMALALGDRVGVLHHGRFQQVASPTELFEAPTSTAVATFVGEPPMPLFPGHVRWIAGELVVQAGPVHVRARGPRLRAAVGSALEVGIRPTAWRLMTEAPHAGQVTIVGEVLTRSFLGPTVTVTVAVDGERIEAVLPPPGPAVGDLVRLTASPREVHVFDAASGAAIAHGV